jgi:signal transduction histidine kinase
MHSAGSRTPARVYLAAGGLLCAVYSFVSVAAQNVVYDLIALSAAAALIAGPRRLGVPRRLPWHLMAAGLLAFAAGDIVFTVDELIRHVETPFPSVADALYLLGYPLIAAGAVAIVRRRSPGRDRGALIDAVIISLGAGLLTWVFVAAPYTRDDSLAPLAKLVSTGYPLMDLLVLAVMVRLVVGGGFRNASFRLLCVGVGALLAADIVYASNLLGGGYVSGGLTDLVWMMSYIAWGAAALHPSAGILTKRTDLAQERPSLRRLVVIAPAAIAPLAVNVIEATRGTSTNVAVVSGVTAVLFVLVLLRLYGLTRAVQANAERLRVQGAELEGTLADLKRSERERSRLLERVMRVADEEREGREIAEEARRSLESLRELQVQFATMAAHEIRTPVTALLGSLWTLDRFGSIEGEDDRELLTASVRQARRLARLCDDLLVVSEATRDTLRMELQDIDIAAVTAETVSDLGAEVRERVQCSFEKGIRIYADPYRLAQILTNLIRNALQYSSEATRVEVSGRTLGDGRVEVTVLDHGPGFAEDDLPRLFTRFAERAPGAVSGLGVGLWIVRRLTEAMNGEISVANHSDGAVFTILLPERLSLPHILVS